MGTRSKANGKRVTCLRQPPVSEVISLRSEVSTLRLANERLGHERDALKATVATYDRVAEARAASTEVQAVEGAIKRMADDLTAVVERVTSGLQSSVADAIRLGDEYGTLAKSALSSARSVKSEVAKAAAQVLAAEVVERGQLQRALEERDVAVKRLGELTTREGLAPEWLLAEFEKLVKMPRGIEMNKAKVRFVEKVLTWATNQRARSAERVQPVVVEQESVVAAPEAQQ